MGISATNLRTTIPLTIIKSRDCQQLGRDEQRDLSTLQQDLFPSNQDCSRNLDTSKPWFLWCSHRSMHLRIPATFREIA